MIRPKGRARERILVYGGFGVGKSRAILTVAKNTPESRFFINDNDNAYERLIEGEEFEGLGNVTLLMCDGRTDFDGIAKNMEYAFNAAGPDDWVVIDMLDPTWDGVQEYFIEKVYGKDIDDYLMEVKIARAPKVGEVDRSAMEMDWPAIKKVYTKRIMNPIVNAKCHVYATSGIKAIDRKRDDADMIRDYGALKGRPAGNKDMGHLFQTVLLFDKRGNDVWHFTTVKDREREVCEQQVFDDFGIDYLVKVGGWVDDTPKKTMMRKRHTDADKPN